MMDPLLNKNHESFREKARAFAEKEVKPVAAELEDQGIFSVELAEKMFDEGFLRLTTPEDGSMLSTLVFQFCGMLFAYFLYKGWISRIKNIIWRCVLIGLMVIATYILVILPVMAVSYDILNLSMAENIFSSYLVLVRAVQFEIFVTAAVIPLVYISRYMRMRLQESNKELLMAKERAEESDAIKTAFLQNISHEFRTPMNALTASSELILDGDIDHDERAVLKDSVGDASDYLLKLLDQIIEFSRVETGGSRVKKRFHHVQGLSEEINLLVTEQQKFLRKEHVEFIVEVDTSLLDQEIYTDRRIFIQLVVHLAENALKFTDRGMVKVFITSTPSGEIAVHVKDTGKGIPEELHQKIFERFYQVDPFVRGVGLSLSLAQKMAELLGGRISVDSELGAGAHFTLTSPNSD